MLYCIFVVVADDYLDKKDRVWLIDINAFGSPTCPLLFEWEELLNLTALTFRIIENEGQKRSDRCSSGT